MKKLVSLLAVIVLVAALATTAFAADEFALVVGSADAAAGAENVVIPVELVNNPGGLTCAQLKVTCAEGLTLVGLELVGGEGWSLDNCTVNAESGKVIMASPAGATFEGDAVLFNVIVNVAADALPASYAINVEVEVLGDDYADFVPAGTVYTGNVVVGCSEHVWDEGVVTKEATCCEAGVITYTCTLCGATKEVAIEATGEHDLSYVANEDGETHKVICLNSGLELDPAELHAYGEIQENLENEGWTFEVCEKCGYVHDIAPTEDDVPPMGDNTMIAVVLATLSMMGVALVVSKKH